MWALTFCIPYSHIVIYEHDHSHLEEDEYTLGHVFFEPNLICLVRPSIRFHLQIINESKLLFICQRPFLSTFLKSIAPFSAFPIHNFLSFPKMLQLAILSSLHIFFCSRTLCTISIDCIHMGPMAIVHPMHDDNNSNVLCVICIVCGDRWWAKSYLISEVCLCLGHNRQPPPSPFHSTTIMQFGEIVLHIT